MLSIKVLRKKIVIGKSHLQEEEKNIYIIIPNWPRKLQSVPSLKIIDRKAAHRVYGTILERGNQVQYSKG